MARGKNRESFCRRLCRLRLLFFTVVWAVFVFWSVEQHSRLGHVENCSEQKEAQKNCETTKPFYTAALESNWTWLSPYHVRGRLPPKHAQRLLDFLLPFLIEEPHVPVNSTCKPPPTSNYHCNPRTDPNITVNARDQKPGPYKEIFNGTRRQEPVKVFDLINFAADLAILELRMSELDDVVDYFVIMESTITHSFTKKGLLWPKVEDTKRFMRFKHKVLYFVIDDTMLSDKNNTLFDAENTQTRELAEKWFEFAAKSELVDEENDILIVSFLDEVPSREAIWQLKHCQPTYLPANGAVLNRWNEDPFYFASREGEGIGPPVSGAIYFRQIYTTTALSKHHLELFDRPRMKGPFDVQFYHGSLDHVVPGGNHFRANLYAPFYLFKMMTLSDSPNDLAGMVAHPNYQDFFWKRLVENHTILPIDHVNQRVSEKFVVRLWEEYVKQDKTFAVYELPWYLLCNKGRFPEYFYPMRDSRVLPDGWPRFRWNETKQAEYWIQKHGHTSLP